MIIEYLSERQRTNNPWRSFYFRCAVFLYSNGNNPVLLRNSSANLLEVEYPTV